MIEKIMKAVKSSNKRRGRNITIGAVIGFLLSCTAVMGADDNYLWIKGDNGKIEFNKTETTDGSDGSWDEGNPYSNNNWDKDTEPKTYTNNTALSSNGANGKDGNKKISYGLRLSGDLTDVNFINNDSITGEISDSGSDYGPGYGIYNESTKMGNIENTGEISGTGATTGYGIYNYTSTKIGDITNIGIINGTGTTTGYGIYNYTSAKIGDITNIGIINGTGANSGYGIGNYTSAEMGNIENTGIISVTSTSTNTNSVGYGIYNKSAKIRYIKNTGIISSTATSPQYGGTAYGIYNSGSAEMGNIENTGIISGTGTSSNSVGSGYGIMNYGTSTMGNIENKGIISGFGNSTGTGIHNKSDSKEMGKITNIGIINGYGIGESSSSGKGYGINNESGTIGDITNIGVISGYGSSGYGIFNSDTMGKITNTGIMSGSGSEIISGSVYAYGIYNSSAKIGNIENTGIISSSTTTSSNSPGSAYGISNSSPLGMGNIENEGIISGTGTNVGYGIYIYNYNSTGKDITNTGIISGSGTSTNKVSSGYGIYSSSATIGKITNTGVIYGTENAIISDNTTVNNYGILVNGKDQNVNVGITLSNNGLIIQNGKDIVNKNTVEEVVEDKEIKEYNDDGTVKSTRKMTIKNKKVTDGSEWFTENEKDVILNALKDTYKVTRENDNVTGSIINAYGTAVIFEGENKQLTLSGTIVNGGIDGSVAISGSDNADNGDTLILQSGEIEYTDNNGVEKSATQNTIVNGNIDMKNGSDKLTVGSGTIINGNIDMGAGDDKLIVGSGTVLNGDVAMGAGDDELEIENGAVINGKLDGGIGTNSTLNFNSPTARTLNSDKINIVHSISNFKNMNINTNVTLFEKTIDTYGKETDLKVTGADEIKIGKNGTLTLRINSSKMGSADEADKIIGHALYGDTGVISSTDGGKLLLALNGAGNENIISFGSTTLGDGLVPEKGTLDTTSALHTLERIDDKEVKVIVRQNIPGFFEIPEYEKLNKIYHGILSVEDLIANFNVDDESLSIFLGYLNDIYAGNPYSYSSELSRKSVGMFRDIAVESQFKPELNKWLIMGGLTHVDGGTKDTYYGKGYYTYDIGSSDMDADTKITGAYMLGEYGVSDTLAYGVVIGGNKLKSDLSNGSKVDGDALYMGAYAKKYIGNLKVTGGLGLQYGDYDADRFAAGRGITETRSYSDNYNDMTYDIYLNGRYSHNIGNNLFLEPYGTLSYTYVDQEGAYEGSKVLAIETDSKSFDYTAAKMGVDLKKVIPHEKGKSTLSAGVSYTRLLTGADEENITGRFKGKDATDFDILVAHKNEQSIGLNAKYTLELESGILFDVKGSYSLERDSHNGTGKNRNKGEWIVGAGLGYKF